MNILYITNHLNIGGITSYILSLATGMKERGHNVYLASSQGELLPRFIEGGITYIPIPIRTKQELSPKIILSLFKLNKQIKHNHIDVIHSNSRTTQVLGCLLNKCTGAAHICTCHGFFKPRLSRKVFPCWGEKVIAISASVKEHLIKDFNVNEKNISVIHNGIDVNKSKAKTQKEKFEIKKKLSLDNGPVVGIVARLSDVKGHIYLIEAMKQVLENLPRAQLLVVGDGKMKQELVNLACRLGIQENIFFIPSVADTAGVLSIMDVFVMPSLKEGLGLSLMEAMASGLAVIGSEIGGIRSLIKHEFNGLLVKPADILGLSKAILELLQNPAKAERLSRAARDYINQDFSQEKMVSETERVYLGCVNAKY